MSHLDHCGLHQQVWSRCSVDCHAHIMVKEDDHLGIATLFTIADHALHSRHTELTLMHAAQARVCLRPQSQTPGEMLCR